MTTRIRVNPKKQQENRRSLAGVQKRLGELAPVAFTPTSDEGTVSALSFSATVTDAEAIALRDEVAKLAADIATLRSALQGSVLE